MTRREDLDMEKRPEPCTAKFALMKSRSDLTVRIWTPFVSHVYHITRRPRTFVFTRPEAKYLVVQDPNTGHWTCTCPNWATRARWQVQAASDCKHVCCAKKLCRMIKTGGIGIPPEDPSELQNDHILAGQENSDLEAPGPSFGVESGTCPGDETGWVGQD